MRMKILTEAHAESSAGYFVGIIEERARRVQRARPNLPWDECLAIAIKKMEGVKT